MDSSSNAYITGYTFSSDFPLKNPFQSSLKDSNAFVSKLTFEASSPTPTASPTGTPTPIATPTPAPPIILSVPRIILAGSDFVINGAHFSHGSAVNFFVATASGPFNAGPLIPSSKSSNQLTVTVPDTVALGQGFVAVQVINTNAGFEASNVAYALLQGSPAAGLPTIQSINGVSLDTTTSSNPSYATNNVKAVVSQGSTVRLGGTGFDTVNGVAIDLFCGCPGGKVGPFLLAPGNAGLTSTLISFALPPVGMPGSPSTGPGSFVVSNAGPSGTYNKKSNAVSAPIGQMISVTSVTQVGPIITVNGTGFSILTAINLFNAQNGGTVNLGGLGAGGVAKISLTLVGSDQFTFIRPAGAVAGAAYAQAVNPPFVPFTSSGSDPGGAFILK